MAILGKIRQRSIFLIIVIGMALFAFVISGVFDGNSANSGPTEPIALINDDEIEIDFFRQMVDQTQRNYNYSTLKSVNLVWNQALRNTIFEQEFEKLGIDAGRDQLEQIISSDDNVINNPSFQNEAGFFDFGVFTDYIAELKVQNPTAYENWKFQEQSIIGVAKQRIYLDLIMSSTRMTESEAKTDYHLENDNVNFKYVKIPYDSVEDSLVNITDAEIKNYISDNASKYKREESRNIQFVSFEDTPTEDDLAMIRLKLDGLKSERIAYNDVSKLTDTIEGFSQTKNVSDFVDQYSEIPFDSIYKPKGAFNNEYANILFEMKKGEVFGPYRDGNAFKISKLLDIKKNASLRASHILISYEGATRASENITRSKSEAKKEANRIYRLARRISSDFEELARQYSDGPTRLRGGDLGFFKEGEMATEFYNYVNKNRVGRVGVVETEFGFHVIKVTDKDDLALIADVVASAIPSEKTSNEVFRKATQFEMDSNNSNNFSTTAKNNNYKIRPVKQINILEENLPGLPNQRNLVRWLFEDKTRVGDIKRFTLNGGGYAVVQLTEKIKAGLASVNEVGFEVKKILSKNKKARIIQDLYKDKNSLEKLIEGDGKLSIENATAVNQKNPTIAGEGNEPKVIGTAFAMNENEISTLIEGENGVYKVVLIKKNKVSELEDYSLYSKQMQQKAKSRLLENIFSALESVSEIKDNRALYY
tara:strand:+ start:939 stop:3056 length:2118 start_codon:yes stop_codon:yes gene_type:complete